MRTKFMTQLLPFVLTGAIGGCAIFGGGPSSTPPEVKPKTQQRGKQTVGEEHVIEVAIHNTTDASICRLHVRESALHDAYGWSSNELGQRGNPNPIPPRTKATIKIYAKKMLNKPDVHAVDCNGKTVMRVYDKPEYRSTAGATWTLKRADEGRIAAVQQARGIKKSTHPLQRQDPKTSSGGIISIKLVNNCSRSVDYCRVSSGTSQDTVRGNTNKPINVNKGDKITVRSGSTCGATMHTVSEGSNGKEVVLCK